MITKTFKCSEASPEHIQIMTEVFFDLVKRVKNFTTFSLTGQPILNFFLHRLDVIRDGQRLCALNEDNIEVFRREKSLESHVTNHLETVSCSIDDLRVGDMIEFETTLIDRATEHPLWVKHHCATFWLDWNSLVSSQFVRIVNHSTRQLSLYHHRIDDGEQVGLRGHLFALACPS